MPLIDNRNLSWEQLFDTPAIITHYSQDQEQQQAGCKYVERTNRKYRKPPAHFSISIERIDSDTHRTTCYPGSILEGVVKIKLDTPLAVHHLKVVYKGKEIFYAHVIGLSNIAPKKKEGDTYFSIQTNLWGIHHNNNVDEWPLLEAGDHQFPFMCEMPMVNYPPSIKHPLVSCDFEMIASLERPGIRPFHTIPITIQYEPFVLSTKVKFPDLYQEKIDINSRKLLFCLPKGRDYNVTDTAMIPIQLHITEDQSDIKNMQICLKRKLQINFDSFHSTDVAVISHVNQSKFKYICQSNRTVIYSISLPILTEENISTTVAKDLSKNIHIEYHLELTAKVKYGFIWSKTKTLVSIPLHFGTTVPGEQLPFHLLHYLDSSVTNDRSLSTKPKFIKVPLEIEDLLPSYHEDTSPPIYLNNKQVNSSSHQLNRIRLMIA